MKIYQSKSAQKSPIKVARKFSIKVRLIRISFSITIMIAMKKLQSRFDEKFSARAR
jgi:hypothetical protein